MSYVLGLDLGTSSIKGVLVNKNGEVIETVTANYSLQMPEPGYSEQNPEEWIEGADKVLKKIVQKVPEVKTQLEGISFSGQMHSLVLLDSNDQVIRPAILWNDVRNSKEVDQISEEFEQEILETTKNIVLEGFTLPKILWVQNNEPSNWGKVNKILLPKDYLGWWLTGNYHMDYSDAAGTLLMDLKERKWSKSILDKYNVSLDTLPKLVASEEKIGTMSSKLKQEYGFETEIDIFAGGADNACAALGAGILDSSTAMVSIGTSGVFLSYEDSSEQNFKGKLHYFHHTATDAYYTMGVTLSAGHSLSWFKNLFESDISYDDLLKNIGKIPAGSEGLLFTPYLVGERTPYRDEKIRGSFIGLDSRHTRDHLARSVLEGITFSLKDSQVIMENLKKQSFEKIVSVGGGAKNPTWLQIQADIFDAEIVTLKTEQGPGFGAAMIASVGLGWFENYEECADNFVQLESSFTPNASSVEKYDEIYNIYRDVYSQTQSICYKLSEVV